MYVCAYHACMRGREKERERKREGETGKRKRRSRTIPRMSEVSSRKRSGRDSHKLEHWDDNNNNDDGDDDNDG